MAGRYRGTFLGKGVTRCPTARYALPMSKRIIAQSHCQQCGSTDNEDLFTDDGYSACCNEIIVWGPCDPQVCYHDED